ncbi:MAG: endolytic transglycosylase MltG, partial [Hyphomicrobiaceae bacterium]
MSIRRPDRDYPARGGGARQRPQRSDGWLPKSPSEALEPTRGPTRPRGTRRRREVRKLSPAFRALNGFLTVITVLLAAGAGAAFWFNSEVGRPGPLAEAKTVVIREGTGARDIAQRLEDEGVISSHHMFIAHYVSNTVGVWFGRKPFQLKAGEYRFEPGMSIRQVADTLAKGRAVLISVTVPEGLTSWQIVERLKANQGLSGDIATIPPDGALMPDTYKVRRGMARTEVIDMMRDEQASFMEKVWESRQSDLPIKTREEALVLASIVEKETGKREERPQVAAVFINRLRQGMRLQSDPTILYGLHSGQVRWGRPITRSDINSRTAHNTYQIPGLPPTPICNPGR